MNGCTCVFLSGIVEAKPDEMNIRVREQNQ